MKMKMRLPVLLLAVLMLLLTPALAAGAEGEDDEPTYIVQLHSGIESITSMGGNLKLKIGESYALPQEGDVLYSDTKLLYPGYTLVGYVVNLWGNGFYQEGSPDGVALSEATVYCSPEQFVNENPTQYKPDFRLREEMLGLTGLGYRADVWAAWRADTHPLTFFLTDGTKLTGANLPTSIRTGMTVALPQVPADAVREGYDFMWTYGGLNYGPGQDYTLPGYSDKTKEVIFTATYIRRRHQFDIAYVTVDQNGASDVTHSVTTSGVPDSETGTVTFDYGTALDTVLGTPAEREGFTFGGWFLDRECTRPLTDDDTKTLRYQSAYAKWSLIPGYTFHVSFEGMATTAAQYGTSLTVPEVPAELLAAHVGYRFGGWSNGRQIYVPGQTVKVSENMTLTALWDKVYHDLIVTENGKSTTTSHIEGEQIDIGVRKKTDYTFLGWFSEAGELVSADGKLTMPGGDLKLEARFEAVYYTVTLKLDGAEYKSLRVRSGESVTLPVPEKTGYSFSGWYAAGVRAESSYIPTGDVTLEAAFEELVYRLIYANNIGMEPIAYTVKYSERNEFPLPEIPAFAGYRFVKLTDANGNTVVSDSLTLDGDVTLTAVYEPMSASVSWVNPATGKTEETTVRFGEALVLPAEPEAPKGYRFAGWYNENGELAEAGTPMDENWLFLTAKFEPTGDGTADFVKYLRVAAVGAMLIGVIAVVSVLIVRTPTKKTGKKSGR